MLSWAAEEFETKANADLAELAESMAPFNAFDVLGNLWFDIVVTVEHEEAVKEPLGVIEQAAEILRHRPKPQGRDDRDVAIPNETTQEWTRKLRYLLELAVFREIAREACPREDGGLSSTAFQLHVHELMIRNHSYAHQERRTVEDLFGLRAGGPSLRARAGFDGPEAIRLLERIRAITQERMDAWRADTERLGNELRDEVSAMRLGESPLEMSSCASWARPFLEPLVRAAPKDIRSATDRLAIASTWVAIGDRLLITAEQLCEGTGLPTATAQKFLTFFSLEFGASGRMSPLWRHVDNATRYHPVLSDGNGRYFVISYDSLLWALRPRFESELKPGLAGQEVWESFNKHRAAYVEHRAIDNLAKALRARTVLRNVTYLGEGKRREVDGVIVVDSVLILVEAKAATLRGSSRKGNAEDLNGDLAGILGKATSQLASLRSAIAAGGRLTFRTTKGKAVGDVVCKGVTQVLAIAVTLEDLNWLSSDLWELFDRRVIVRAEPPLLFNLHDLEVICEISEFPCQLVHYLVQRAKMATRRIFFAADELDYFAQYIRTGIDPEGFERYLTEGISSEDLGQRDVGPMTITLGAGTEELDAYYWGVEGVRPPAPKPRRLLPAPIREILAFLDIARPHQFLAASLLFLELTEDAQEQFAGLMWRLRILAADGRSHDGRVNAGDFGITVMIAPRRQQVDLGSKLERWCRFRKYQTKASTWLGLGFISESPETPSHYIFASHDWKRDIEMDAWLDVRGEPKPLA